MTQVPQNWGPDVVSVTQFQNQNADSMANTSVPEGAAPYWSVAEWLPQGERITCTALTKAGKPCGSGPIEGTELCLGHTAAAKKAAKLETVEA